MNEEGCMLVGSTGSAFVLRLEGRLTHKSLWNINSVIALSLSRPELHDLLIDVSACSYMDSTMLGSLARWAISFRETHDSPPYLVGLYGHPLESIFTRMCLPDLFRVAPANAQADVTGLTPVKTQSPPSAAAHANGVLHAHETLAELSPENEKAFAVLIRLLKREGDSS